MTPQVGSATRLFLTGLGMMAVGAGAVVLWRRGRPGLTTSFGLGAVAWLIGVGLKALCHALAHGPVLSAVGLLPDFLSGPAYSMYAGSLTGIFECGVVLLIAWRTSIRQASWDEAVAFGIGKGSVEAVLTALGPLFLAAGVLVLASIAERGVALPSDKLARLTQLIQPAAEHARWSMVLVGPLSRSFALIAHTFSSALIVYALRVRQQRWFWLSFAYLSAVDGLFDSFGHSRPAVWWGVFLSATIVALLGLRALRRAFRLLPG
jgi:uncharacterized membrane protein YhfC